MYIYMLDLKASEYEETLKAYENTLSPLRPYSNSSFKVKTSLSYTHSLSLFLSYAHTHTCTERESTERERERANKYV